MMSVRIDDEVGLQLVWLVTDPALPGVPRVIN